MRIESTVLASWVMAIYRTVQTYGVLPDPLLAQAGIDKDHIAQYDSRIPSDRSNKLWDLAVEATGDPLIGLNVPENMTLNTLYSVDAAAQASSSFGEFIRCGCRFSTIVTTAVELELEENSEFSILAFKDVGDVPLCDQAIDAFMTVVCMTAEPILRYINSPVPFFIEIDVSRPRPDDHISYESAFPCQINYSCAQNALKLNSTFFEEPLPGANPDFLRLSEQMFVKYLSDSFDNTIELKVRNAILALLVEKRLSKSSVAERLCMSERNLTRKLSEAGLTFRHVVETVRKEKALQLIETTSLSLGEIAFQLDFDEVNSFIRVFRRWTGVTPGRYRNKCLGER